MLLDQIRYALSALEGKIFKYHIKELKISQIYKTKLIEAPPTAAVTSFNVPAWLLPATSSGSRSTKTLTSAAQVPILLEIRLFFIFFIFFYLTTANEMVSHRCCVGTGAQCAIVGVGTVGCSVGGRQEIDS